MIVNNARTSHKATIGQLRASLYTFSAFDTIYLDKSGSKSFKIPAKLIIGKGKNAHIISIDAYLKAIYRSNSSTSKATIAYWNKLAAIFQDPPKPAIFDIEHARKQTVTGYIYEVRELIADGHRNFSSLKFRVEVQVKDDKWAIDRDFEDRTKAEQQLIVDKWLAKLLKEEKALNLRPYHWVLSCNGYDHIVRDSYYREEPDINDEPDAYEEEHDRLAAITDAESAMFEACIPASDKLRPNVASCSTPGSEVALTFNQQSSLVPSGGVQETDEEREAREQEYYEAGVEFSYEDEGIGDVF